VKSDKLLELIQRIDFDRLTTFIRNNRGGSVDNDSPTEAEHDLQALEILAKQYMSLKWLDGIVDEGPLSMTVPVDELGAMFVTADEITRVEVQYDEDPLKMANDAIDKQKELAVQIATTLSNYM